VPRLKALLLKSLNEKDHFLETRFGDRVPVSKVMPFFERVRTEGFCGLREKYIVLKRIIPLIIQAPRKNVMNKGAKKGILPVKKPTNVTIKNNMTTKPITTQPQNQKHT
jgi:hypothetical protein